jgi:voltage-gated potassium channel
MGVIIILGQWVGKRENWSRFDALYWTIITATTVGYGDLRPTGKMGKVLAVLIAFIGLVFTGIMVAIALQSVTTAFAEHREVEALQHTLKTMER